MSVDKKQLEELGIKDNREFTYFRVENSVIDSGLLKNVYQIALYTTLCRYANNKEYCYPSLNKLSEVLGCSKPKIVSTLNELLELGVIKKVLRKKESGANTSNLYGIVGTDKLIKNEEEVVNEVNHPSKSDLLPLVNEVNYPSKCGLPNKELYKKNYIKKVVVEEKITTATLDTFKKSLKTILPDSLKQINGNTVRNIFNYSNGDINALREALAYMHTNNKPLSANVLVAILKDGDYKNTRMIANKPLSREGKIKFMLEKIDNEELKELKEKVLKNYGTVEPYLGNVLCKRFNKLRG